ncbi:protein of unknown function DUF161 [Clostridium bornimense]|uniref:Integral membrane protein n=1 Tax=Clostridium bornimense TaxID=1216932 RepID=W6SK02_9CLOT|nr:membrane protein [Clostridium bornimense]CDM70080.1 protein of unknown function DUF161 [Clostridium bornimense]
MKNLSNFIKRLILFFLGISVIQFGVAIFLETSIGSDPFTVFTEGLAKVLSKTPLANTALVEMMAGKHEVTPGIANMIILIVLFIIILLVDKKRIKIGTLICVAGVGPIIDLSMKVVSYFQIDTFPFLVRSVLVLVGCFIIAVGFSIASASNIGVAPNDIIPFIIQDKTKFQYRWIRISMDAILLVTGFLLGGTIGLGTIIAMLAIGPFIQLCLPYGEKVVNLVVKK